MKDIVKSVLSIVGPAFAVLLLGFTGFQTWSLLLAVSGSPIIAAIGLMAVVDGLVANWTLDRSAFPLVDAGTEIIDSYLAGLRAPRPDETTGRNG